MATTQLTPRAAAQTSGIVQLGDVAGRATFISDEAGGVAVQFDLQLLTDFQVRLLTHYQRATRPVALKLPRCNPRTVAVIGFERAIGMVYVSPR